jgi:hypothetical protein
VKTARTAKMALTVVQVVMAKMVQMEPQELQVLQEPQVPLAPQALQVAVEEDPHLLPVQALVKEYFELELAIRISLHPFAQELPFRVATQFSISKL